MSLSSNDFKRYLQKLTGTTAKNWSRWAKYTVGSPADLKAKDQPGGDPGRGHNFLSSHSHLVGCTVRVFGAPSDQPIRVIAVFEKNDQIVEAVNLNRHYPMPETVEYVSDQSDVESGSETGVL